MKLTNKVFEKLISISEPFNGIMYNDEHPIPNNTFNKGLPKQADNAIIGNPMFATLILHIKSPREFPTAKIVTPRIASDKLKTIEKNFIIEINSVAIVDIQVTAMINPRKAMEKLKNFMIFEL
ncbi:hypothetical protein WICMUC_004249 [Wickerhamomyces mucosus]|uniref:Uncharacterized protein n=1 Tax=Wickerhamomyces mucosus TaxID=1378264 RepID=A0A9P8PHM3_9ASCO|nr:hypothetical protein WICMUC_004249 [Wickerhamomyces mucosus]